VSLSFCSCIPSPKLPQYLDPQAKLLFDLKKELHDLTHHNKRLRETMILVPQWELYARANATEEKLKQMRENEKALIEMHNNILRKNTTYNFKARFGGRMYFPSMVPGVDYPADNSPSKTRLHSLSQTQSSLMSGSQKTKVQTDGTGTSTSSGTIGSSSSGKNKGSSLNSPTVAARDCGGSGGGGGGGNTDSLAMGFPSLSLGDSPRKGPGMGMGSRQSSLGSLLSIDEAGEKGADRCKSSVSSALNGAALGGGHLENNSMFGLPTGTESMKEGEQGREEYDNDDEREEDQERVSGMRRELSVLEIHDMMRRIGSVGPVLFKASSKDSILPVRDTSRMGFGKEGIDVELVDWPAKLRKRIDVLLREKEKLEASISASMTDATENGPSLTDSVAVSSASKPKNQIGKSQTF
jgi:hypothetical protein